jgi:hypothetical protein
VHVSKKALEALMYNFNPSSWSGSLSAILINRLAAIEPLQSHENETVRKWTATAIEKKRVDILRTQQWEQENENRVSTSFEP